MTTYDATETVRPMQNLHLRTWTCHCVLWYVVFIVLHLSSEEIATHLVIFE